MTTKIPLDTNIKVGAAAGSGLYGRVWKAEQHGREVAVKVIHPQMRGVANALEHFHSLARVPPHLNIVQVFTVAKVKVPADPDPVEAVVMEWLDGVSLDEQLRGPILQFTEGLKLCLGIVAGLRHLHTAGVAHGDLHAGNVIVTAAGPKIIDIDCTKSNSLRLLTLQSREDRIQADLDYIRHLLWRVLTHTDMPLEIGASVDPRIRGAASLEAITAELDAISATVAATLKPTPSVMQERSKSKMVGRSGRSREDVLSSSDIEVHDLFEGFANLIDRNHILTARSVAQSHIRRLVKYITSDRFSAQQQGSEEEFKSRVKDYCTACRQSCACVGALAFSGHQRSSQIICEALDIVANCYSDLGPRGGTTWWLELEKYPAALLLHAAEVSAVGAENYSLLKTLLLKPTLKEFARKQERLSTAVSHWKMSFRESWNSAFGSRFYTPISVAIEEGIREPIREVAYLDSSYVELFDTVEYLSALIEFDKGFGLAIGSFIWRGVRDKEAIWDRVREELKEKGATWPPIRSGLFDSVEQFKSMQDAMLKYMEEHNVLNRYW